MHTLHVEGPILSYSCVAPEPTQLGAKRTDYLDFDWKDTSDDLAEIKTKYDDFLRQEKSGGGASGNWSASNMNRATPGGGEFGWTSRKRPAMGSNRMEFYDMYDEFEDEIEDDRPPPPKEQEKRYLNGKHMLTNREIT